MLQTWYSQRGLAKGVRACETITTFNNPKLQPEPTLLWCSQVCESAISHTTTYGTNLIGIQVRILRFDVVQRTADLVRRWRPLPRGHESSKGR